MYVPAHIYTYKCAMRCYEVLKIFVYFCDMRATQVPKNTVLISSPLHKAVHHGQRRFEATLFVARSLLMSAVACHSTVSQEQMRIRSTAIACC